MISGCDFLFQVSLTSFLIQRKMLQETFRMFSDGYLYVRRVFVSWKASILAGYSTVTGLKTTSRVDVSQS